MLGRMSSPTREFLYKLANQSTIHPYVVHIRLQRTGTLWLTVCPEQRARRPPKHLTWYRVEVQYVPTIDHSQKYNQMQTKSSHHIAPGCKLMDKARSDTEPRLPCPDFSSVDLVSSSARQQQRRIVDDAGMSRQKPCSGRGGSARCDCTSPRDLRQGRLSTCVTCFMAFVPTQVSWQRQPVLST